MKMWKGDTDHYRCQVAVSVDGGETFNQCKRKTVLRCEYDDGTYGFCYQHNPNRQGPRNGTRRDTGTPSPFVVAAALLDALTVIAAGVGNAQQIAQRTLEQLRPKEL